MDGGHSGTGRGRPVSGALATEDDTSVAQGFFSVTVRPWQVMLRARP